LTAKFVFCRKLLEAILVLSGNVLKRRALTVFFISSATVIGPTTPGTGVINEHNGATDGKCTSPVNR